MDDEIVLYDPSIDAAHVLNPTAALVWWLCDGNRHVSGIVNEIAGMYDNRPDSLETDVETVLTQFAEAGVIRWK